jgi:hypothetical protein
MEAGARWRGAWRGSAQVAEWLMAADCKSAAPCELRRFESSPVHQILLHAGREGVSVVAVFDCNARLRGAGNSGGDHADADGGGGRKAGSAQLYYPGGAGHVRVSHLAAPQARVAGAVGAGERARIGAGPALVKG